MNKAIRNWDRLQATGDLMHYRDVHEAQQLERTSPMKKMGMSSRTWLSAGFGLILVFGLYMAISIGGFFYDLVFGREVEIPISYIYEDPEYGYQAINKNGEPYGEFYTNTEDVPVPYWYEPGMTETTLVKPGIQDFGSALAPGWSNIFWSTLIGGAGTVLFYMFMVRNLAVQNASRDHRDINQHDDDQHLALPEELHTTLDWFPDAGAHADVEISTLISHTALSNKGLRPVAMVKRHKEDVFDKEGNPVIFKGEFMTDEDGELMTEVLPMMDTERMQLLFDKAKVPKRFQTFYDPTQIVYNPFNSRDGKEPITVADRINEDWEIPYFETERPAGAYMVDTRPINTMYIAISRAGKGQMMLMPQLDCWLREKTPSNILISDPKGEFLRQFYVRATVRGYQPIQFNLINDLKTDIFNPLVLASEAAREGLNQKCAEYIENIATVFFPQEGGEDPVWSQAGSNAFKRASFGLIEYFLEEEKELREKARLEGWPAQQLETEVDKLWGYVTPYNCYQLFVQLSSKKMRNPAQIFNEKQQAGEFDHISDEEYNRLKAKAEREGAFWEGKPEADLLTLYFNATMELPKNGIRTLVDNADKSLRSMADAEKMLASVYGIAITAMSFFTDPKIACLTSGRPSQSCDLAGFSFLRRLAVRFSSEYMKENPRVGMQAVWQAYEDPGFKKSLGKDFYHEDLINREGWTKYFVDGVFPNPVSYIKLEIKDSRTGLVNQRLYFRFTKSFQISLDGSKFVKDPVLEEKIVKNGTLEEMIKVKGRDGKTRMRVAPSTFKSRELRNIESEPELYEVRKPILCQQTIHYTEKPKCVFLVNPPHMSSYAKILLVLISQLVNLNFDQSYLARPDQKPHMKMRFLLDELGNLKSGKNGIDNFQTLLSIGLGQSQYFHLVLQTLQQLEDIYGTSCNRIIEGNVTNIIFLKSTDDEMIEALSKKSGVTHKSFVDSKTVNVNQSKVWMRNESQVTYSVQTSEVPVIKTNDLRMLAQQNSIVFRAAEPPVWNRNQTFLPMAYQLYADTIIHPGHEYTLQTIPTQSEAIHFNVKENQPDFGAMFNKRMKQAMVVKTAKQTYKDVYGYSDDEIARINEDLYADEIMTIVNAILKEQESDSDDGQPQEIAYSNAKENASVLEQQAIAQAQMDAIDRQNKRRYLDGMITSEDLFNGVNACHDFDPMIIKAFLECRVQMAQDKDHFYLQGRSLYDETGDLLYIRYVADEKKKFQDAAKDPLKRVYAEGSITGNDITDQYEVTDDFYAFLASLETWDFANGAFEKTMRKLMNNQ